MPQNFRLMVNQPSEYVDLFPVTDVDLIKIDGALYKKNELIVDVPVYDNYIQEIPILTSQSMVNSPFEVYLIPKNNDLTEDEKNSYSTISQIQVVDDKVIIIRLKHMPKTDIKIKLVFYEGGV